jgi:hypothetical protein
MISREAIYAALWAQVADPATFQTSGRILKHWADVTDFPALFQAQKTETASKSGRGESTKWQLSVDLYIYAKTSQGAISATQINNLLDTITNALEPTGGSDKQTLGGLVHDCWIDGQIMTDEGTLGDLAVAIIPVHIIVV